MREADRARNATWIVLWSRKPIPLERMDGSPASADNSRVRRTPRDRRTARHRTGTGGMGKQSAAKRTTRLCVSEAAH